MCIAWWYNVYTSMTAALLKTETLSAISRDIAQVLFAALFIEPLVGGSSNVPLIVFGSLLSLTTWVVSLVLAKS